MKYIHKENRLNNCITCGAEINGLKKKYCNIVCKNKHSNKKYKNYECQQIRGTERRLKLLLLYNNKCSECGYNKNFSALCFHHTDPSTKKFQIDIRACSNRKWETLVEEAAKCKLLCSNCHIEHHYPHNNI